jgi:hypothetical protein
VPSAYSSLWALLNTRVCESQGLVRITVLVLELMAACDQANEIEIDVGVVHLFTGDAATDFEIFGRITAAVNQLVAVGLTAVKSCCHPSPKQLFA